MPRIREIVSQVSADGSVEIEIPTFLGVGNKRGWNIKSLKAMWLNPAIPATMTMDLMVQTETGNLSSDDDRVLHRIRWSYFRLSASGVLQIDAERESVASVERLTVQPSIFIRLESTGSTQANSMLVEVEYDDKKLPSDTFLQLAVAGV